MLTESQSNAIESIKHHFTSYDYVKLLGSAGVGKTYILGEYVKYLLEMKRYGTIYCTAPTNKAVRVLKEKIPNNSRIQFITTQKALKLKRHIDKRTGQVSFKPEFSKSKNAPLDKGILVIVDEASMLNTELTDVLEGCAKKQRCKILYVGDDKQINPVGEEISPIFIRDYPTVELTEIVRQAAGNPIIQLSRDLEKLNSKVANVIESGGYLYTEDRDRIIKSLAINKGTSQLKYLAYTNREVDSINSEVRKLIYGRDPAKIELGEILVFDAPYKNTYINSEEIKVEKLDIIEKEFKCLVEDDPVRGESYKYVTLKCYSINANDITRHTFESEDTWKVKDTTEEAEHSILVVHEDSEEKFKIVCKELAELAKIKLIPWTEFYKFSEDTFASLKYNHALTVHKSQGSTFEQVILNYKDININPNKEEVRRLLYTGVTRASHLLIIYNT